MRPREIDGAHGEGGGQLLRVALALAALTGQAIRIDRIRAHRDKPGLAPQHLAAVRAVADLCGASVTGHELRSQAIAFSPAQRRGGRFRFDVGTAGSTTLVLQAVLPALLAAPEPAEVVVTGGTDVRMAPPIDYLTEVMLPLIARMGARIDIEVPCRGYYPRGGGEVRARIEPARLQPLVLLATGPLESLHARVHVANLPVSIAERMRDAMLRRLSTAAKLQPRVQMLSLGADDAVGAGGAVVAWAKLADTVLGAGRVAERGVRAETLGDAVGNALAGELASGATLDRYAGDQILLYLAMANGTSAFTTRRLSSHARTVMWLIEQFLPVSFKILPAGALVRVEVESGWRG